MSSLTGTPQRTDRIWDLPLPLCVLELTEDDDQETEKTTRDWIKRRGEKGYETNIIKELSVEDCQGYKEMMRI